MKTACAILGLVVLSVSTGLPLQQAEPTPFVNVAPRVGITFRHDNAASPQKLLIETMGAGCAWLDYDNDGLLDAFFVNSGPTAAYQPRVALRNALYRNRGDGTFTDVTAQAGLSGAGGFYMGATVGDYDNDGFPDLYITGVDRSMLYHNERNGRFRDVTSTAGVSNPDRWASSAAFFDFDNDGLLDLMVVNYLDWHPETNSTCQVGGAGSDSYCHPKTYKGLATRLYRNTSSGRFRDVSESAGIARLRGRGLGLVAFDFNLDGWLDVFVANDAMENFLWRNNGDGTFAEVALEVGVAYSEEGLAEAGMGVDVADLNEDSIPDIFVTHYHYELNRLFLSSGENRYEDSTLARSLAFQGQRTVGFGTRFLDYDNDGLEDLVVVNGHVIDNIERYMPRLAYAQPRQMFRNTGSKFLDVSGLMGPDFTVPRVGRGVAVGDFDNDGYADLLVSNNGGPAELLRNGADKSNHWLGLRLIGRKSNRDGIGARVTARFGERVRHFQVVGGGSYLSASDPRRLLGLGTALKVDQLVVRWPSGAVQTLQNLLADRYQTVEEPGVPEGTGDSTK